MTAEDTGKPVLPPISVGSARRSPGHFEALDALRGICAMLVVLFHFHVQGWIYSLAVVRKGWMFVDFFFVLSGFVILHA